MELKGLFHWLWQGTFERKSVQTSSSSVLKSCFLLKPCALSLLRLKLHGYAFFVGKSVVFYLLEGPEWRLHYWEDREEEKAQHPAGFEPASSLLQGMCSTAVLQPLPWCWRVDAENRFNLLLFVCLKINSTFGSLRNIFFAHYLFFVFASNINGRRVNSHAST